MKKLTVIRKIGLIAMAMMLTMLIMNNITSLKQHLLLF